VSGNDSNPATEVSPRKTIAGALAHSSVGGVGGGTVLHLKAGTYTYDRPGSTTLSGTNRFVRIQGETTDRNDVIIDSTDDSRVCINVHLKHLRLANPIKRPENAPTPWNIWLDDCDVIDDNTQLVTVPGDSAPPHPIWSTRGRAVMIPTDTGGFERTSQTDCHFHQMRGNIYDSDITRNCTYQGFSGVIWKDPARLNVGCRGTEMIRGWANEHSDGIYFTTAGKWKENVIIYNCSQLDAYAQGIFMKHTTGSAFLVKDLAVVNWLWDARRDAMADETDPNHSGWQTEMSAHMRHVLFYNISLPHQKFNIATQSAPATGSEVFTRSQIHVENCLLWRNSGQGHSSAGITHSNNHFISGAANVNMDGWQAAGCTIGGVETELMGINGASPHDTNADGGPPTGLDSFAPVIGSAIDNRVLLTADLKTPDDLRGNPRTAPSALGAIAASDE
jgi:hypothetical protein